MSGTYQGFASLTATPNTLTLRDENSNITANSVVQNIDTITSAASTTTLNNISAPIQVLTGTQSQILTLPDTTTLIINQSYQFINNSTSALQINVHSGSAIVTVTAGTSITIYCTNNSTSDGLWVISQSITPSTSSTKVARAVVNGVQNVGNSPIPTAINISAQIDPQSWIDAGAGKFQPSIEGYYQVYGAIGLNAVATGSGYVQLILNKNGSPYSFGIIGGTSGMQGPQPEVSDIVYLNGSTDYLTFTVSQNITATMQVVNLLGSYFTFSLIN